MLEAGMDFWVFGYGSLIWRPGFDFVEKRVARLHGYHRALCVFSHVHRGTRDKPGLVLGLDRGGSCRGIAYKVAAAQQLVVLAYLRAREQATMVYLERPVRVRLDDGTLITAITYVADRRHAQYAGQLPRAQLLALVQQGVGISGKNPEYIFNTHQHLEELAIHDATLAWLVDELGAKSSMAIAPPDQP